VVCTVSSSTSQRAASDPTARPRAARVAQRLPKALSEAQVVRLLDDVRGRQPPRTSGPGLLEFLYGPGARVSEAVGLDLAGLAELAGKRSIAMFRVYKARPAKERLVPLHLMAALAPSGIALWRPEGRPRRSVSRSEPGRVAFRGPVLLIGARVT